MHWYFLFFGVIGDPLKICRTTVMFFHFRGWCILFTLILFSVCRHFSTFVPESQNCTRLTFDLTKFTVIYQSWNADFFWLSQDPFCLSQDPFCEDQRQARPEYGKLCEFKLLYMFAKQLLSRPQVAVAIQFCKIESIYRLISWIVHAVGARKKGRRKLGEEGLRKPTVLRVLSQKNHSCFESYAMGQIAGA